MIPEVNIASGVCFFISKSCDTLYLITKTTRHSFEGVCVIFGDFLV